MDTSRARFRTRNPRAGSRNPLRPRLLPLRSTPVELLSPRLHLGSPPGSTPYSRPAGHLRACAPPPIPGFSAGPRAVKMKNKKKPRPGSASAAAGRRPPPPASTTKLARLPAADVAVALLHHFPLQHRDETLFKPTSRSRPLRSAPSRPRNRFWWPLGRDPRKNTSYRPREVLRLNRRYELLASNPRPRPPTSAFPATTIPLAPLPLPQVSLLRSAGARSPSRGEGDPNPPTSPEPSS